MPWDHATQTDAPPPKLFGSSLPRTAPAPPFSLPSLKGMETSANSNHELAVLDLLQRRKPRMAGHVRKCLYEVLGVERTATDDDIKKAYRKVCAPSDACRNTML